MDITPTWEAALGILLNAYDRTAKDVLGDEHQDAVQGILQIADVADAYVAKHPHLDPDPSTTWRDQTVWLLRRYPSADAASRKITIAELEDMAKIADKHVAEAQQIDAPARAKRRRHDGDVSGAKFPF